MLSPQIPAVAAHVRNPASPSRAAKLTLLLLPRLLALHPLHCRYLDLLRAPGGVSEWIWEESRALAQMRFDFRDKPSPYGLASSLSHAMQVRRCLNVWCGWGGRSTAGLEAAWQAGRKLCVGGTSSQTAVVSSGWRCTHAASPAALISPLDDPSITCYLPQGHTIRASLRPCSCTPPRTCWCPCMACPSSTTPT